MGQATQIYTREFDSCFASVPLSIRARVLEKIAEMGRRLDDFPHQRLQGRQAFKLRVGDYRIIYNFDAQRNELYLITIGHRREVYR